MTDDQRSTRIERRPERPGQAAGRGREAASPTGIPPRGWADILKRVKGEAKEDNVPLLSAGVAFYAFLAVFPALIAAISIYGLVADPADVQRQIASFASALPGEAQELLTQTMTDVAEGATGALSLSLVISIAIALWSASSGMAGLIKALNTVYDEPEGRGFVKLRGLALLLTLGAIVAGLLAVGLVAVLPAVLGIVGLQDAAATAIRWLRWPVLAVLVMAALAVLYRIAPDRDDPRMKWVTPGAIVATLLWLVASGLFSLYVTNFGNYNRTYGALAGVVILLFWLFITGLVILLGAEINAEMEAQTAKDTTVGDQRPMGERNAVKADTLGEAPG